MAAKDTDSPHILLVDDEHFILNALRLYFETNGFLVSTAANGQEALQVYRDDSVPIDVVILDLVMPGCHGLDLLRTFKRLEPAVQVIIATGCGSMGSAIEALRLGAFDFITKPIIDFENDLMKSVNGALAVRREHRKPKPGKKRSVRTAVLVSHWYDVYEQLNDLVSVHFGRRVDDPNVETSDDPRSLTGLWSILRYGFGADATAIVARGDGPWQIAASEGFTRLPALDSSEQTDLLTRLSGLPGSSQIITEQDGDVFGDVELFAHDTSRVSAEQTGGVPARWSRVLALPLLPMDDDKRLLLLFYQRPPSSDVRPEAGPLALLTYVVGQLLGRSPLEPGRIQLAEENPPTAVIAGGGAKLDAD
ncbi:MAG: response regulator [Planctomycetota bacterium]|nr:response regulator [Planctomycetota bacterium]